MNRVLSIITTLLLGIPSIWAYDFSIVSADGSPRYYTITGPNTVEAASPHINGGWNNNDQQPSGELIIPSQVIYQNNTFTVTAIGFWAFGGCSNITSVTIPSSVKFIDMWAFYGCANLVTINFPLTPVYVSGLSFHQTGWYNSQPFNQLVYLGNTLYKYKGCTQISEDYSITIPSNTNSIAGRAFSTDYVWGPDTGDSTLLVSVSIPNSVKYIGDNAFNHCKLTNVVLPDSLEHMGEAAFSDTHIKSIIIPQKVKSLTASFIGNDSLTSVTLLAEHMQDDSTLHFFTSLPFSQCPNLSHINIGNSVTCIANSLFYMCQKIDTITIPNSVRTIGRMSFVGCTGLKSLTIGEGVDSISPLAFSNLDSLAVFNYNAINCSAFSNFGCNANFHLNIGGNVRRIPDNFLLGCSYFSDSITLPYGLRHIGRFAFCMTGAMGKIDIPATVDSIGYSTFMNCQNINGIICRKPTPPVLEGVMGNYNLPLEVPCNSIVDYQSAPNWCNYSNITVFGCNYTIEVVSNDNNAGYVTGGGTYSFGETVTLNAISNNGYLFDHWQDGNTENPRTITVTSNATYIAYFVSSDGIESFSEEDISICFHNGQIVVDGTSDVVQIFDMTGRNVRNEELPAGVYIVKIGNHYARKVVVVK